jgi:tetratricopeptide (TPR) repeat protein
MTRAASAGISPTELTAGSLAEILGHLSHRYPNDAGLWIEQGEAAARGGKPAWALRCLEKAETLKPNPKKSHRLALVYQALGQYRKAVAILERLTQERPADAAYLSDKGLNEHYAGLHEAAIRDLKEAIRLEPGSLSAYLSLGAVYVSQGRSADALALYDQALSAKPDKTQEPLLAQIAQARAELLPRK